MSYSFFKSYDDALKLMRFEARKKSHAIRATRPDYETIGLLQLELMRVLSYRRSCTNIYYTDCKQEQQYKYSFQDDVAFINYIIENLKEDKLLFQKTLHTPHRKIMLSKLKDSESWETAEFLVLLDIQKAEQESVEIVMFSNFDLGEDFLNSLAGNDVMPDDVVQEMIDSLNANKPIPTNEPYSHFRPKHLKTWKFTSD